jgi:integrase
MTLDNIFKEFISTKELTLKKHTVRNYVSVYNKHISLVFGFRTLDTINYIEYQKFADTLIVNGLAPKTVKNILKVLSSVTTFAIKCDWYDGKDYVSMVELPHFDNKFYVTFSPTIQKHYLLALKNATEPIYKDMFLFILHGRRLSEVLDLEWEYLDLNQGVVYYPASKNKSKKHLAYELTTELLNVLKLYHAEAIERQNTPFVTGHVFLNPVTLKRFHSLQKPWKRLLKRNNLTHYPLHKVRHILSTYLLNELQLPLETVSFVLGHSSVEITKRYLTFKPQIAKNAIDILFEDMKTDLEKATNELDKNIKLGECLTHVQTLLFSDKKFNEVTK